MRETAMSLIIQYMDDVYFEPDCKWSEIAFKEHAYGRWACCEMIERIMNHPYDTPEEVIKDFSFEMEMLIAVSDGDKSNYPFIVGLEAAEDILDQLAFIF